MKNILLLLFIVFAVVGCDKRKDLYKEKNEMVGVTVQLMNSHSVVSSTRNGLEFTDTLKLSHYYRFKLNITDENDYVNLKFSGSGSMYMDGSIVSGAYSEVIRGEHLFEWVPDSVGDREFQVSIKDSYDVEREVKFKINVFTNRLPSVLWSVVNVGNISPLEKKIVVNATDGDEIYGGGINYYEFVINQDTTYYTGSTMYYVFPSAGNYLISVRALDNDNQWSSAYVVSSYQIN